MLASFTESNAFDAIRNINNKTCEKLLIFCFRGQQGFVFFKGHVIWRLIDKGRQLGINSHTRSGPKRHGELKETAC